MSRVAVLMGGTSSEREVSLNSGRAVLAALTDAGVDCFGIDVAQNPVDQLTEAQFDVAFIALHGGYGEGGQIQALLELMGKPYTGSNSAACAMALDKIRAKRLFAAAGVPVAQDCILDETNAEAVFESLGKVMVKPTHEGSSVGSAVCDSADAIAKAFDDFSQYGTLMAEQFLTGDEYTVSIVNNRALPAIRIKPASGLYDYAAKYQSGDTEYLLPAGLSDDDEAELQSLALACYHALGCSGWGRVDFIRAQGQFVALEVNTVPGMTSTSLVPKAAASVGIDFSRLCTTLVEVAHG